MRMHEPGFLLWDLIDNKKLSVGVDDLREMDKSNIIRRFNEIERRVSIHGDIND